MSASESNPFIPNQDYFGLHFNQDTISATITTDPSGVQVACQSVVPDPATKTIVFQEVEWNFDLTLGNSEFSSIALVNTAAGMFMNYFENEWVQNFLDNCSIDDDWDVIGVYFNKPHGVACVSTGEDTDISSGDTTYQCTHSYRLYIVETIDAARRRELQQQALQQSSKVQFDFQRKLNILSRLDNEVTLAKLHAFQTNFVTSQAFADLVAFVPGVDDFSGAALANTDATFAPPTTTTTTTVATTPATAAAGVAATTAAADTTTDPTTTAEGNIVSGALDDGEVTSSGSSGFGGGAIIGAVAGVVVLVVAILFVVGRKRRRSLEKHFNEVHEMENLNDLTYEEEESDQGDRGETTPDQGEEDLFSQSWLMNNTTIKDDDAVIGYRHDERQPFVVHDEAKKNSDDDEGVEVESAYLQGKDGYFCPTNVC